MSYTIGLQIDPPEVFNFKTDSTFVLALEAQRRGKSLFYYTPEELSWKKSGVHAQGFEIRFFPEAPFFEKGKQETIDLATLKVILVRQNPPFHMPYLTTTYLLETLPSTTYVANPPSALRNFPEKLIPLQYPHLMPPTLISRNREEIAAFREEQKHIVLKPLYGYASKGVFSVPPEEVNFESILQLFLQNPEPFMIQKYLPEVQEGDKRVLLLNGKVAGCFRRKPKKFSILSSIAAGAEPFPTTLTPKETMCCEILGDFLSQNRIWFAGVDLIGETVTEVNITSPTGIPIFNTLFHAQLEKQAWDALEENF